MRKIVLSLHSSLDGYVAGPNGEMDWIKLDPAMFDLVGEFTKEADTALYGRVTYGMMEAYWPAAADKPNASKHDREHSAWYNTVDKVVFSNTLAGTERPKTRFIGAGAVEEARQMKQQEGKNILIFGSPTAAHSLMEENLIDEYWLFVNPILLGKGIPVFDRIKQRIGLVLLDTKIFASGITGLHYQVDR